MKTNDPCRSCVDCGRKACQTSKESLYPDYCLTKTASEEERNSIRDCYIDDTENNQIMNAAAKILNDAKTDLNIVMGLCVGHDILFHKYIQGPTTTLVVKDRVLAHNPAAALYTVHSFNKDLLS